MYSDQKNWDAALIKTWRTDATLFDTVKLASTLAGKQIPVNDLLRAPRNGFPWSVRVRVFIANRLPKINERLWAQEPAKDIMLLRKLETSKYDITTSSNDDPVLAKIRLDKHRADKHNELKKTIVVERNSATDWKTVKG